MEVRLETNRNPRLPPCMLSEGTNGPVVFLWVLSTCRVLNHAMLLEERLQVILRKSCRVTLYHQDNNVILIKVSHSIPFFIKCTIYMLLANELPRKSM